MVDVLMLSREHGPGRVALAVRGALAAGAHDGRAVAVLARRADATGQPRRRRSSSSSRAWPPTPGRRPSSPSTTS